MAVKNPGFSKKINASKQNDGPGVKLFGALGFAVAFIIYLVAFAALFSVNFYWAHKRNAEREKVFTNPAAIRAGITRVHNSRHDHKAEFAFYVGKGLYNGETFQDYYGAPGDSVCITYNRLDPSKNIYCADSPMEPFKTAVLESSATGAGGITAIAVFVILLQILRKKINARKKNLRLP